MIDMHCHILPQVDDGSRSLSESLRMIDIAYNDGIRKMVATPHINHPAGFEQSDIKKAFGELKAKALALHPDMELYLGAEVYASDGYINILKNEPYGFTINGSRYVLVEFDRTVSLEYVLDAVHELKIRGYTPIIAHAEKCEALFGRPDKIRILKGEGACIQITSSGLVGKNGRRVQAFLKGLVMAGLVDFIASDAHREDYRRPLLKEAYNRVAALVGIREADRIFTDNPKAVIEDRGITGTYTAARKKRNLYTGYAAAALIFILTTAVVLAKPGMDTAPQRSPEEPLSLETDVKGPGPALEKNKEPAEGFDVQAEKSDIPEKEEIENRYINLLTGYQKEYEEKLDVLVSLIREAREAIEDPEERKAVVQGYLDEVLALEDQADTRVYHALYDLQNELEEYGCDVSGVQRIRDEYHRIKQEKTSYYINQI